MVKRTAFVVLTLTFIIVFMQFSSAESQARVFDGAGLLSFDELTLLDAYISELRASTGFDFVFLSDTELEYIDDYDSASRAAIAHADDFYDYGGFGDELNDWSGMIFYIDMINRIPVITTTGEMIDIINDLRLAGLFNIVYSYLDNSDFYGAAYSMFEQAAIYIEAGPVTGQHRYEIGEGGVDPNEYYDSGFIQPRYMRSLSGIDIFFAVGAGFIISLIYFISVKSKYNLKGSMYRYNLLNNTEAEITVSSDTFLRQTVTRTLKQNSYTSSGGGGGRGSGTHTGSSGRTHGGGSGGRRF